MDTKNGNPDDAAVVVSTDPEDFYYSDLNVPCQGACPVYTNIPAYIRALHLKQYDLAYEINRQANILPGVLGRICSRPCENSCRHGEPELGKPVNICHIKRAAADLRKNSPEPLAKAPDIHKKVAIIGAGPAGLAAAHDLARAGVSVTIYESFEKPGGMLRYGIPEFRLPREIIEQEIAEILALGITLKCGVAVGKDIELADLSAENDAVLIAAGCYRSRRLDVPGEDLEGVYSGLDFMTRVCLGNPPPVGERVLVIGAGFTAFDCARSALRLGAKYVRICLRRTEDDLAVTEDEISATKVEGISIQSLMLSKRIVGNGKAEAVEFVRSHPGGLRPDGKREVTAITGSEFTRGADTVIVAAGQSAASMDIGVKRDAAGDILLDDGGFQTSQKGLFVAGDYASGPSTVISAIAKGRQAANQIIESLTGECYRREVVRMTPVATTDRFRSWDFLTRNEMPAMQPVSKRIAELGNEVEIGFTDDLAAEEAKRCYLCHLHYEIDIKRCIYCRYCIDAAPRNCIKMVESVNTNDLGAVTGYNEATSWRQINAIMIDNSRCIRCGECLRVCPVDCISVTKIERGFSTV